MDGHGRTALLVVNAPASRTKDARAFAEALQAGGMSLIRRECERGRLSELIASMRGEIDCVVLAGGDALFSAGAIALRDSGLPLGILPAGGAGYLAETLGIPGDPAAAAAVVLDGHQQPMPLGSVNGQPFFTVATVGMTIDADLALRRAAGRAMGGLRFPAAAARTLLHQRRFSAIIRCGAVVHRVRTLQVTIGNGWLYAGGLRTGAQPGAAGPGLQVYSLEPAHRLSLLSLAHLFAAEPHLDAPEIRLATSAAVEVVTRLPQPICADGEVMTVTPARFSLLPQSVQVFVPRPALTDPLPSPA